MSDEQIIDILSVWDEEFTTSDILSSFLRRLGFAIANGIASIATEIENLAKTMYSLLPDLISDSGLSEFITAAKPLLTVLLSLSIMAMGYIVIVKKEGKSNVLQNFLIIFLVLTVMPMMSSKVATLTAGSAEGIFNITEQGESAAYDIIDDNITDLYMLMEEDRITDSQSEHERIIKASNKNVISPTKKSVARVKAASVLDYDENSFGDYDELVKNELDISPSGSTYLVKMNGGIFDASHDYYYRYHINWLVMLTSLIAMFITLLLLSIRLAKMIWEIVLSMFIAPFVAVTDVATGQRIKELLRNILSLCAVMGIISVILGVYNMGMNLLSNWQSTGKIGNIVYLVLLVSLASITIEGPDIVQRIYGISAGGKGPLSMLSGVYYGSRMAKEAAKVPIKAGKTGVDAVKKGLSLGKKGYQNIKNLKNKESSIAGSSEKQNIGASSSSGLSSSEAKGVKAGKDETAKPKAVKKADNPAIKQSQGNIRNAQANANKSSALNKNISSANVKSGRNERMQTLSSGNLAKSPKIGSVKQMPNAKALHSLRERETLKAGDNKKINSNAAINSDNRIIYSLKEKGMMDTKETAKGKIKGENLKGGSIGGDKQKLHNANNFGKKRTLK